MQGRSLSSILAAMDAREQSMWISDRLLERFGEVKIPRQDPLETLVRTILSQNTTDTNRDRAYVLLRERFASLDALADAGLDEVAATIRIGGLHRQKARSIVEALNRIRTKSGKLSLSFLRETDLRSSLDWLLGLPGVGHKTAGIVLLFSFGKPYFPIDTHIRRVLTRFGVIRVREDPHRRMNAILPQDPAFLAALHLHLIRLGRTICHPRQPSCSQCPIRAHCRYVGIQDRRNSRACHIEKGASPR